MPSALFSLQAKLVLAMTALIVLAVLSTGAVFVLRNRQDLRMQEIRKLAASAPFFTQSINAQYVAGEPARFAFRLDDLAPDVDQLAMARDQRVLIIGDQGTVLHDTSGSMQGITLTYPPLQPEDIRRGFMTWQATAPANEDRLTFIASTGLFTRAAVAVPATNLIMGGEIATAPADGAAPQTIEALPAVPPPVSVTRALPTGAFGVAAAPPGFGVVLAVESSRIDNAWMSALPSVGIAGAIAMPFAVLVAVVLARQIARPVSELTLASEAMARGEFDQRVEVERDDEVGRLAKAFSSMAERIGQRDTQMRALVANVSHDLKTPMTSILGYAQAVKDGVVAKDDIGRVAGIIQTQAEQTSLLLNDLLFLSEVDAGQVLRAPQEVHVADLLQRAIDRVAPLAEQRNVTLEAPEEVPGRVSVDLERSVRALANVMENAVKFSAEGATVRVDATQGSGRVRIDVENDGPQIAEEELPRLFDRFYRGTTPQSGHGLGLAIARETIEMDGGNIGIANTAAGVVASIELPLAR